MRSQERSYSEWCRLSAAERRQLMRSWDPGEPKRGESTRGEILEAFGSANSHLLDGRSEISTGYFSEAGWSIIVVTSDEQVEAPATFGGLPVIVGVVDSVDWDIQDIRWRE